MFNSIYLNGTNIGLVALMIGLSLVDGIIVAFLCSLKLRARKGVFITTALLPAVVSTVFCVLNVLLTDRTASAITSIAAIMIGMGLIRFRSAPAKAEEILILLMAVAIGAINGLGYVAYAAGIAIILPLVYFLHLKNLCQNCAVYCVCNVLCLCLTSLTCNSMSRRRKEKDSFMRFVIVSILPFTWLFPLQTQRPLHFLLVLTCLFGSGRP